MPFKRCKLPDGRLGWKWSTEGKYYPTLKRAAAEKAQATRARKEREKVSA